LKNSFLFILVIILMDMNSCDIVKEPYLEQGSVNTKTRKVLLEEFTGHQCPNCPAGAAIAGKLEEFYGNKLIIIAYHSGFFARTNNSFPADYRTPEATELEAYFNVQFNPAGVIDRTSENTAMLFSPADWGGMVAREMAKDPAMAVEIVSDYKTDSRLMQITVICTALENLPQETRLCLFLTEDSLVSPQSVLGNPDYPQGVIPDYIHMHVFRTALNTLWGEKLFEPGTSPAETKTMKYTKTLDNRYNPDNCHIVAFVYNNRDKVIMQAESVPIK
jgi:thiol-disulfide isomerase/thioredoxin